MSEFDVVESRHDRDMIYPVEPNGGMPSLTTMLITLFAAALIVVQLS